MKIIITEEQYKKIESHLTEAKSAGYDRDTQEKLGNIIRELIENISKDKSTEFVMSSGNKLILKCISDESDNFVFSVVEDKAQISKKWDTLSIQIKFGNGQDLSSEYRINKNVISTQDNGVTFDLLFIASKKNGLKSKLKVNKIRTIGFSSVTEPEQTNDPEKQEEPKTEPEQQDTNSEKETTDDKDDEYQKKGEEALAYMLNDPILKSAFYEQPSLWQLFVAELTGKKTKGKGIITVIDLIDKYKNKNLNEKFIVNGEVVFIPKESITLKSGLVLEKNSDGYKTTVLDRPLNSKPKLKGVVGGVTYIIEIKYELKKEEGFMSSVKLLTDKDDKKVLLNNIKIKILEKKSSGFKPNN
jgi:hypothetical protein